MDPMQQVWANVKRVKVHLKKLHKRDYGNLHEKIDKATDEVSYIQTLIKDDPTSCALAIQEKEMLLQLNKYVQIDDLNLLLDKITNPLIEAW